MIVHLVGNTFGILDCQPPAAEIVIFEKMKQELEEIIDEITVLHIMNVGGKESRDGATPPAGDETNQKSQEISGSLYLPSPKRELKII